MRLSVRIFVVVLVFAVLYHGLVSIVTPKFLYDGDWATTNTFCGFYNMEKESIDVIIMGSSMAASSIIPQLLYDEYGILSYNLGCEQQNLLTSYYWLLEALKYQKPKVLLLETFMLYGHTLTEPLYSDEPATRKAFDYMRWSANKVNAVNDICSHDSNQSELSYYIPTIRYHDRWKSLGEKDFKLKQGLEHSELKGYAPLYHICEGQYEPFDKDSIQNTEQAEILPLMKEYAEKIFDLCKDSGIEVILYRTPGTGSIERYRAISDFCRSYSFEYYDFGEASLYNNISYNFYFDNSDAHPNVRGAQKMTKYMGKILQKKHGVSDKENWQWEITDEYYKQKVDDRFYHPENEDNVQS